MTHSAKEGERVARKDTVLVPSKGLPSLELFTHKAGNAHLERRLYQKLFEASAFLVCFLMGVRLIAPK
jgi:hypothetical protein